MESQTETQQIVKLRKVWPNKNQPRKVFDETALLELAQSIQMYGVIQPIVVRKQGSGFEIIAGERRWRAAKLAGLREIPVIVKEYTEQEVAEVALIENLQRMDLNAMEQAKAYRSLLRDYGMTHDELAKKLGKSRSSISNAVRFLKLPELIQSLLVEGSVTEGHAKVLLGVNEEDRQIELANQIVANHWSVRELEEQIKQKPLSHSKLSTKSKKLSHQDSYVEWQERLGEILGTKVTIRRKTEESGKIEINFYSVEDLERISTQIAKKEN